jgi:hypothetical protein
MNTYILILSSYPYISILSGLHLFHVSNLSFLHLIALAISVRYCIGGLWAEIRFPTGTIHFPFLHVVHISSAANPASFLARGKATVARS